MDDSNSENNEDEEDLLMAKEMANMRQRLSHACISNSNSNHLKTKQIDQLSSDSEEKELFIDSKLIQWLNELGLRQSFYDRFIDNNITYNALMHHLSDEQLRYIFDEYFCDFEEDIQLYFINEWKTKKKNVIQDRQKRKILNRNEMHLRKKMKNSETNLNVNENEFKCNALVLDFLSDFNLLELQSTMAENYMDMSDIAQINEEWMNMFVIDDELQSRLKIAIKHLRKEIVSEFLILEEMEEGMLKNKGVKKKKYSYDPLYLLMIGFGIFIVYTFFLFVFVGI